MISVGKIQRAGGVSFERSELSVLISRGSRASLDLAWRLIGSMKDEQIHQRSDRDQSTYLHHIVNQVTICSQTSSTLYTTARQTSRGEARLIHDLLFLNISTIESAVGKGLITHCRVHAWLVHA